MKPETNNAFMELMEIRGEGIPVLAGPTAGISMAEHGADVFIEGYRPGCMDAHGFGYKDLMEERPGLIYVSVDCFGPGGIYSDRAGWDQVAQAVTGMAYTQGQYEKAGQPKLTSVYCCDFLTGFLGAFGAMVALNGGREPV